MLNASTNALQDPNRRRLFIGMLLVAGIICVGALWKVASSSDLGEGDFTAYWSAAYLVHQGQSPYDQPSMMEVQHTLTNLSVGTITAWNPPTLFVFLLPLGWLPFFTAKSVWFVANVIMLLAIAVMLTRLYLPPRPLLIAAFCVFVVLLPQALLGVAMGQVTFLVVLGVVTSLTLIKREQWFWAGFALILTTIKPHLVILVIPYLLLYALYRRRWQLWLGLFCAGLLCMIILFVFRPPWIIDLAGILHIAPVNWATPTIGGFLSFFHITEIMRYLFVIFLPLAWFLSRPQVTMPVEAVVALLIILTVPTTFFGWSYDQTILTIPIAQLFGWLAASSRNSTKIAGVAAILIVTLLTWSHRILTTSDVYYVWIPLAWAAVYGVYFIARALNVESTTAQIGIGQGALKPQ